LTSSTASFHPSFLAGLLLRGLLSIEREQLNFPVFFVLVLPEEDDHFSDLLDELRAGRFGEAFARILFTFGQVASELDLDQLVRLERFARLFDQRVGQSLVAHLNDGLDLVRERAQALFIGARQRHARLVSREGSASKAFRAPASRGSV
jgi:hypothetical protein